MTVIAIPDARRSVNADSFRDLTTLPVSVLWMNRGITLRFDGELDEATRRAVIRRCVTVSDNESQIQDRAEAALEECRAFLALEAPTQAQALAQIRLLTRVVIALIRLVLRKLDGVN